MNVDPLDYLVLNGDKDRKFLVQAKTVEPLAGICCDENFKNKSLCKRVDFQHEDIICNYGKKLVFGQAYGLTLERVRLELDDYPEWATVRFYCNHNETERKLVRKSVERVTKTLLDQRIFPKEKAIDLHIKDVKGPLQGMYYHRPQKEGKEPQNDLIDLRIKDFGTIDYTLYHELGHGVWFQLMSDDDRAAWVKAFTKNITLMNDIEEKVAKMRGELVKAGSVRDYKSDLEEEDADILDHITKYIAKTYNVKPIHLNILIKTGDDLQTVWPRKKLVIPQTQVMITPYSAKNCEEYFCEAFAHYFSPDKTLAKSITTLVEKTITSTQYSRKGKQHG